MGVVGEMPNRWQQGVPLKTDQGSMYVASAILTQQALIWILIQQLTAIKHKPLAWLSPILPLR